MKQHPNTQTTIGMVLAGKAVRMVVIICSIVIDLYSRPLFFSPGLFPGWVSTRMSCSVSFAADTLGRIEGDMGASGIGCLYVIGGVPPFKLSVKV